MFKFKTNLLNLNTLYKQVDKNILDNITWGTGVLKDRSVLLWDLENISYKRFHKIKKHLRFATERAFIVTMQEIGTKKLKSMHKHGFEILTKHKTDSDTKIKNIYKILKDYDEFVFISSDSDFVDIGMKVLTQKKKLTWIVSDCSKKRIIMKMNLADENLRIVTISNKSGL